MDRFVKFVITVVICVACPAMSAWTQSGVELQHGGPYSGALPEATAGSLKDAPQSPAAIAARLPPMTQVGLSGNVAHMMPTAQYVADLRAAAKTIGAASAGGPLVYHANGPIMGPNGVQAYAIFWDGGGVLQNGVATGFSANYGKPTLIASAWLQSHGLMSIATQYYQTIGGVTTYFQNMGGLQAFVVDHGAFPASGCTDTVTPGNCISDAQMQTKIAAVMTAQGWTGGLGKIFILFTSSGEGSCFTSASTSCAYTQYCAYHSFFTAGGQPVIYAIIPYGNPSGCQTGGQTTPNDLAGDLAANVTTHEIMEAATDPLLNAWFDSTTGDEIGDICNFTFGPNTWGSGNGAGNQMWNGVIMEVQEEYSNHTAACLQAGP
jgi:hypothetical protein